MLLESNIKQMIIYFFFFKYFATRIIGYYRICKEINGLHGKTSDIFFFLVFLDNKHSRDLPKSIMSLGPKLCYKARPNGQLQKISPLKICNESG